MVHNEKLFSRSSVTYRTFSEGPTWNDLLLLSSLKKWKMKIHCKLSKNCSIHDKNHEISRPYEFWTPIKSNIPDVWNWNCWPLFGSEIEEGGHGPPAHPHPPKWLRIWSVVESILCKIKILNSSVIHVKKMYVLEA